MSILLFVACLLLAMHTMCSATEKLLLMDDHSNSANKNINLTGTLKTVCLDIDIADSSSNNNIGSASPDSSKVFVKVINFDNVTICEKVVLEQDKFLQCQVPLDYVSEGHNVFYVSLYDVDTGAELGKLDSTFFISNDAEVTQWKRQKKRNDLAGRMKRLEILKKITASLALFTAITVVYLWSTQTKASDSNTNTFTTTDSSSSGNDDSFFRPPSPRIRLSWWQRFKYGSRSSTGGSSSSSGSRLRRRSPVKTGIGALVGVVGVGLVIATSQGGLSFGGLKIGTSASTSTSSPPVTLTVSPAISASASASTSTTSSIKMNTGSKISVSKALSLHMSSLFSAITAPLRVWPVVSHTTVTGNSSIIIMRMRSIAESVSRRISKLWNDFLDD